MSSNTAVRNRSMWITNTRTHSETPKFPSFSATTPGAPATRMRNFSPMGERLAKSVAGGACSRNTMRVLDSRYGIRESCLQNFTFLCIPTRLTRLRSGTTGRVYITSVQRLNSSDGPCAAKGCIDDTARHECCSSPTHSNLSFRAGQRTRHIPLIDSQPRWMSFHVAGWADPRAMLTQLMVRNVSYPLIWDHLCSGASTVQVSPFPASDL